MNPRRTVAHLVLDAVVVIVDAVERVAESQVGVEDASAVHSPARSTPAIAVKV
jgi:hypothetical protein